MTTDIPDLSGAHILVVEDNKINQLLVCDLVEKTNASLTIVENGQEAVDAVMTQNFDAVLMDVQMPIMDGHEATRTIRKEERLDELPIIALTANTMNGEREKCLDAGMNDYISKPIKYDLFYSILASWVGDTCKVCEQETTKPEYPVDCIADLPEILPGIDITEGLRFTGGNQNIYLNIARIFLESYTDRINPFVDALNSGDFDAAHRWAHSLGGHAGTLGAKKLWETARALESACEEKKGQLEQLCIEGVGNALDEVIDSLGLLNLNAYKDSQTSCSGNSCLEDDDIQESVAKLAEACSKGDISAEQQVSELMKKLVLSDHDSLLPVAKLIEDYDFDKAALKLREITAVVVDE